MDKIIEFIKRLFGKPYRRPVNLDRSSSTTRDKYWISIGDDDDDDDNDPNIIHLGTVDWIIGGKNE